MLPTIFWPVIFRTWRKKAGLFNLRAQTGRFGTGRQDGPKLVVPLGPVAAARADPRMIAKAVVDTIAKGASTVGVSDREAKPHLHHDSEERAHHVQPKRLRRPST